VRPFLNEGVMIYDRTSIEWKFSYNGKYLVSEYGDIINSLKGNELSPTNSNDYLVTHDGISYQRSINVHRIVYEVFVGVIPEGLTINHIDGNKTNNHYSNLELMTLSDNVKHAHMTGLVKYSLGSDNGMSKLVENQILHIYTLFLQGWSNQQIADIYGVDSGHICSLRIGARWKHLFDKHDMFVTYSLGKLPFNLNMCRYIYKKCMIDKTNQRDLGKMLGIDPSTVSRIRSGKTWKYFGLLESEQYINKQTELSSYIVGGLDSNLEDLEFDL
jgi:hypothetical protein